MGLDALIIRGAHKITSAKRKDGNNKQENTIRSFTLAGKTRAQTAAILA
jgi:hypothetical protein